VFLVHVFLILLLVILIHNGEIIIKRRNKKCGISTMGRCGFLIANKIFILPLLGIGVTNI
jgi:hypothetical protein